MLGTMIGDDDAVGKLVKDDCLEHILEASSSININILSPLSS